ncbi:MAG: hypothetical protein Q8J78_08255 [Moraxellaceae bacterium]|nr:hypothetical protein [Moraxellaceae bacterium]
MPKRILLQEPWSYVLFEDDGDYIVTFTVASHAAGSAPRVGRAAGAQSGDYSVMLNAAEQEMQKRDRSYVERLVKRLTDNPAQLHVRRLRQAIWPDTAY